MPETPNGMRWRLDNIERRVDRLEDAERTSGMSARLAVVERELENLGDDVRSLRKGFYSFAFGMVLAAVTFALSILVVFG